MNQSLHEDVRLRNCRPTLLEPLQQPHGVTLHPAQTHAESPLPDTKHQVKKCLPRASGGGPAQASTSSRETLSSPRERGWSRDSSTSPVLRRVFPARAGVVRGQHRRGSALGRLPRASGGGPSRSAASWSTSTSSPRERGWSTACTRRSRARSGLPRASGGGPNPLARDLRPALSSPRERGWSVEDADVPADRRVFPARAGMVPGDRRRDGPHHGLPRASGGGPRGPAPLPTLYGSSPRERGWSRRCGGKPGGRCVFPARAGVVPRQRLNSGTRSSLPRASGGGPRQPEKTADLAESSPLQPALARQPRADQSPYEPGRATLPFWDR